MHDPHIILTITSLLGAFGLWLMLPRGTPRGRTTGIVLGVIALGIGLSQIPWLGQWAADGIYRTLAGITVVSAAAAVTFRNPVYCAIWFGMSLLGTAGLFFFNGAPFLSAATVVVYAGAILVTFLFVLMLAQPEGKARYDRASWEALLSAATGVVIVGILSMTVGSVFAESIQKEKNNISVHTATELNQGVLQPQHVAALGAELFGKHIIAIEVAGVLLLAAIVGAAAVTAMAKTVPNSSLKERITVTKKW